MYLLVTSRKGMESVWAVMKRDIHGVYHHANAKPILIGKVRLYKIAVLSSAKDNFCKHVLVDQEGRC